MTNQTRFKKEKIICPECKSIQKAEIENTLPFAIMMHRCTKCEYIIMESEWDALRVKPKKNGKKT